MGGARKRERARTLSWAGCWSAGLAGTGAGIGGGRGSRSGASRSSGAGMRESWSRRGRTRMEGARPRLTDMASVASTAKLCESTARRVSLLKMGV